MVELIVTHAGDAPERARRVAARLEELGYKVRQDLSADAALSPHARRKMEAAIENAACVLVLWSKGAAAMPALLAAATAAKAGGKLALARLDGAVPPASLAAPRIDLSGWMGRDTRAWRSLLASLPGTRGGPQRTRRRPTVVASARPRTLLAEIGARLEALAAAAVMLIVVSGAAYFYAKQNGLPPNVAAQLPPALTHVLQK